MILRLYFSIILLFNLYSSFAQVGTEHDLVRANRIESKLRANGFIVLGHYVDGLAPVERKYKKSFVDSNGNYISTIDYSHVSDFSQGFASVKRNDAWTLINTKGEEQFEPNIQFSGVGKVKNGVIIVTSKKENRAGLARANGGIILPMQFDFINPLDSISGNYLATMNGQFLLLNSLGKALSDDVCEDFSCGEASDCYVAKRDGRWLILNLQGKEVSKFSLPYDFVEAFSNGFAVVRKNGKSGYINSNGKEAIPLKFDDAYAFNQFGHAPVTIGSQRAMIDRYGKIFLKGDFEVLSELDSNMYRIVDSDSQYMVDSSGKKLWAEKHYLIEPLAKHLYKVIPLTDPRLPFFANQFGEKIADYGE